MIYAEPHHKIYIDLLIMRNYCQNIKKDRLSSVHRSKATDRKVREQTSDRKTNNETDRKI